MSIADDEAWVFGVVYLVSILSNMTKSMRASGTTPAARFLSSSRFKLSAVVSKVGVSEPTNDRRTTRYHLDLDGMVGDDVMDISSPEDWYC